MSTPEPGELTQPVPTVEVAEPQPAPVGPPPEEPAAEPQIGENGQDRGQNAAISTTRPEVTFVPMAVSVGDGFKFGCGFFMAFVLTMLVGFVLLAALFALNSLIGLNLPPLGR